MLERVVVTVVDAQDDRDVDLLVGRRDQHFAGAGIEVQRRLVAAAEPAGRLDDDVNSQRGPVQSSRVALRRHNDSVRLADRTTASIAAWVDTSVSYSLVSAVGNRLAAAGRAIGTAVTALREDMRRVSQ